nr:hypothetical protein JVH1_3942 [Rhodococcus sp. JVH1]
MTVAHGDLQLQPRRHRASIRLRDSRYLSVASTSVRAKPGSTFSTASISEPLRA